MTRQAPIGRPIYVGEMYTLIDAIRNNGGEIVSQTQVYGDSGIAAGVCVDLIHWRRHGIDRPGRTPGASPRKGKEKAKC